MKINLFYSALAFVLLYGSTFAMENDDMDNGYTVSILNEKANSKNEEEKPLLDLKQSSQITLEDYYKTLPPQNRWGNFLRNRIASLYYATSVAGYGSNPYGVCTFFNSYFSQTNNWEKLDYSGKTDNQNYNLLIEGGINSSLLNLTSMEPTSSDQSKNDIVFSSFFKKTTNSIKIMTNGFNVSWIVQAGHQNSVHCEVFDLESNNTNISIKLIQCYLDKFSSKKFTIYSIIHVPNHLVDVKIEIDSSKKSMVIEAYDSFYWNDMIILNKIKSQCSNYFAKVAQSLGLNFSHTYNIVGNQIFNMYDCGRFSTIYLLYDLELNKSPLSLSAQDIYHGFQILEKNGYEKFHAQSKSMMASSMDYVRSIQKYFLSEPPANKPNLPLVNQDPVENKV